MQELCSAFLKESLHEARPHENNPLVNQTVHRIHLGGHSNPLWSRDQLLQIDTAGARCLSGLVLNPMIWSVSLREQVTSFQSYYFPIPLVFQFYKSKEAEIFLIGNQPPTPSIFLYYNPIGFLERGQTYEMYSIFIEIAYAFPVVQSSEFFN